MTTWFITRHPGARVWADRQRLAVDRHEVHLDPADVAAGDVVIGALPVHLAAAVCARGARYINISLDLPAHARGRELDAEELAAFNARLEEFAIVAVPPAGKPHG